MRADLFPPLLLLGLSSGIVSGFSFLAAGGSYILSNLFIRLVLNSSPFEPSGVDLEKSILAHSAEFVLRILTSFIWKLEGAFFTKSIIPKIPKCFWPDLLNPSKFFLWFPSTWILQAGILASAFRPPAHAIN